MNPSDPPQVEPSQEPASLLLRLAGPSTTKAGLSAEQSEINRVIAEASKGSKFYENEKRKDREVTARVERILKLRDEAVRGVDMGKVEQRVDRLLEAIERERDLTQYIVHVDMDAFYANVELLDDPTLAGKPFGVGQGVLCTASYEARKYGVRSGMPSYIALKLCPELLVVDLHMPRYVEVSRQIMSIFRTYDPNMLAASVDEAYIKRVPPITEYCGEHGLDPETCVQQMRQRVVDETKLTVSAGIAANKMLAKVRRAVPTLLPSTCSLHATQICSDKNKPNGQFRLAHTPDAIKAFMRDLPIRKIPGIGRVNERLLDSIGVRTCGDIHARRGVLALLDKQFGLHALLQTHLGIASNTVQPWSRDERKSIGAERTFKATADPTQLAQHLDAVVAELAADMARGGWAGRTLTLKYKRDTYEVCTRARALGRAVCAHAELRAAAREMLAAEGALCLRLVGLRATKLVDLRRRGDGIAKFFEPRAGGSPSKRAQADDGEGEERHDGEDSADGEDEEAHDAVELDAWDAEPTAPAEPPAACCPLCGAPFGDNAALNAHVDWCLSREAIRSAQVGAGASGGAEKRPREAEGSTGAGSGAREWWKAARNEDAAAGRGKRRKAARG
ncbi:hypothetical protein BC834DRAFT_943515 [Gloeopeniophorella convolvens]|nr:hypothetical protein BC834DRAFT_943515 [Gloeopeniophorella convolvens]